jgi:hypothetical protein
MIVAELAPGSAPAPEDDEVLAFLFTLGRSVETALRARKALLTDLLGARQDPSHALERAGRASRRCVRAFDDALLRLRWSRVPTPARECADELRQWLEAHVEACDHLNRAATARERADLEQAMSCLALGERHAQAFNVARQRLAYRLASKALSN